MMAKVLAIEDEEGMRDILKTYLEKNNFDALFAEDGSTGINMFKNNSFDIVLLDVMLPDMSGWNVLRTIRESSKIPVMMITARSEEYDRLLGFELGADDYVVKPFSPREVIARIKAILSRSKWTESDNLISFSGITIDTDSRVVKVDGKKIDLTPKEFDLLNLLAQNIGKALSREKCLNVVWGYEFFGDLRTVDTHIKQLREKLGDKRDIIKTVWGYGYKLGGD